MTRPTRPRGDRPLSALAASALLALAACRGAKVDGEQPRAMASTTNPSSTPSAPIEVQRREYNLTLHHEVSLPSGLVITEVTGTLSAESAARETSARSLRLDLRGLRASARQQGKGGQATFEGLERPMWVALEPQGQATTVHFEPEAPASTRQLVEYVISELFHAHHGEGSTWQATARDNSGTFSAEYRREGRTLTQRKLAYSSSRSGGPLEIEQSERRLELSEHGVPARLTSKEKLKLVDLSATVTSTASIELATASALTRPADWLSPSLTAQRFRFGDASLQSQAESDRQLMGRFTLEQTLDAVKQASGRDLAAAMTRLSAFIRQDAKALPAVQVLVERGGCPPERLISPLLVSGTETAHALLARWLEAREPAGRARLVASELMLREPPQRVLSEAIVRVATDAAHPAQARAAHLAGTIADKLQAVDPTYAAAIVERLLDTERGATNEIRVQLLGGLGNSGHAAILSRLEERLKGGDSALVRAATAALWRLSDPRAARLLEAQLADSPEPEVRLAAARACRHRHAQVATCSHLNKALQSDADSRVRGAALDAIAQSTPNELKAALKVAAKDADQGVRDQAARLSDSLTRSATTPKPSLLSLGAAPAQSERKRSM